MYAATQTEWRPCGPPGGYSLPVCFNDSDMELSTRGTPITDKVQMIIESLRSSQSSLEMGDEIEGNGVSGQEAHPQVCKVPVGPYVGAMSKGASPSSKLQEDVSSGRNYESSDSDSDDSVDRGIEEAILEYLKEKDNHKRKGEPCSSFVPPSKIPRKTSPVPEISQHNSDSNTFMIAGSQFPKGIKVEPPTAPAAIPIKKYIKNKASLYDGTFQGFDLSKCAPKSLVCSQEWANSSSQTNISTTKAVQLPIRVKVEEETDDSSSDDGIEEAIQRYQLEKKEQQNKREAFDPHAFEDDSDSTSDDGIEEAIRHYQLQQNKERSAPSPFLHKEKSFTKTFMHAVESTSTETTKKHKLKKKKARTEKDVKSLPPSLTSGFIPKTTLSDASKGKGNGLHLFKDERLKEEPALVPSKVNTTAELMCAEAILDISKTVIPGPFHQTVGPSSRATTERSSPENCPDDESDDSSIDSEDGIELEIRKFLEQKAQMHKKPPGGSSVSQESHSVNEQEKVKAKEAAVLKKKSRLSLTQRRKQKNLDVSNIVDKDGAVKDVVTKPSPEPIKESKPLLFSQTSNRNPASGLYKADQSGDKSSSFDSDEDLDNAIKDLLKTKKKSKKKIRDLKQKSRKCLKDEEPLLGSALQAKKLKPDPISKCSALTKAQKSKDDMKEKPGLSKETVSQHKQIVKSKELGVHDGKMGIVKGPGGQDTQLLHTAESAPQMKDDSSSVDSDDSIELEIRRFLAEKAKVSTTEKSKDEGMSRNGTMVVCTPLCSEDIKQENQLAEIPRTSISPLSSPLRLPRDFSATPGQSHLPSVQSCSPSLLEPADGAGAARSEQKRPNTGRGDIHNVPPQMNRVQTVLTPNMVRSHSESMKWRQSLGLPTSVLRAPGRTPFQITSSETSETTSAPLPYHSGGVGHKLQTEDNVWSCARTSRAPFSCTAETDVNTTYRSTVLNFFSTSRQHPKMSLAQSLMPGHRSQCSVEEERKSTVHISKDKSVFVELESNRTNHVQIQSRDRSEGKQRADLLSERKREGESIKIEKEEVLLDIKEEEFIDEPDCESVERRTPEQKQGFSTLSLSRAIDPGITIRPCIALTSDERVWIFRRRYQNEMCKKGRAAFTDVPVHNKEMQHIKRKLQFAQVNR